MEFKEYKLGEIVDITMGQSPPSKYYSEETGLPFLQGNKTFGQLYPSVETFTSKTTKIANKNDILFSVRAPVGDINIAPFDLCIGRGLCSLKPKKIERNYLFYLLKKMTKDFEAQSNGTIFSSINKSTLMSMKVKVPGFQIQRYIGNVLRSIDNKILNNNQIIANLEDLSQTLFKQWFVDFEFPDENGIPYKSSGGEMVESELGEIPKGWEVKELKDIVKQKKETFNPQKTDILDTLHFSLPAFDNGQTPVLDNTKTIKSNKWIINENCCLFSKMNPKTPRIWLPQVSKQYLNIASSEFVVLESDNTLKRSFIYNVCHSKNFNEYLVTHTTGSTNSRQRVKPQVAMEYPLPFNEKLSEKYGEKIASISEKIINIRKENQKLTSLRNTLLPKLMSGEIEIPDDFEVDEVEL